MRVLVVDDHPVVLNGTAAMLQEKTNWIIWQTMDGADVEQLVQQHRIDLCLIDIQMPHLSGTEIAKWLRAHIPTVKIVLYTGYDVADYYPLLFQQAIDGLLSKTATVEQLIYTLQAAMHGDIVLPKEALVHLQQTKTSTLLEPRELQVLQFVAQGLTNKAIAQQLTLSQRTIEHYLSKIFSKLQVESRAQAVSRAKDLQLID